MFLLPFHFSVLAIKSSHFELYKDASPRAFPHVFNISSNFFFIGLESVPSGESQSVAGGDEDALDEYQELSTREEQDIESMMETCEYAISNAEAFTEQLSRELQVLDGVS